MKIYNILLIVGVIFTSCDTTYYDLPPEIDYNFEMVGRCPQDDNGYYHLKLIQGNTQTLHRFGASVTNVDKWNLPTQVFWSCEDTWTFQGIPVHIVNFTSYADPQCDSVFSMMAPVWGMQGDTTTIYGRASFEEGDITKYDSFNIIFE